MRLKIGPVRTAFFNGFTAKAGQDGGEPRYSSAFIIDPKSQAAKDLEAAVIATAKEKWGEKAPAILKKLYEEKRVCFQKAPRTNGDGEPYSGFENAWSLNATNKARPTILDRDKTPLTEADGRPYSGCYVYALLETWAQDNAYGKRINCTLRGVQFAKDGDAFGGGTPASEDEFDELEATADDLV